MLITTTRIDEGWRKSLGGHDAAALVAVFRAEMPNETHHTVAQVAEPKQLRKTCGRRTFLEGGGRSMVGTPAVYVAVVAGGARRGPGLTVHLARRRGGGLRGVRGQHARAGHLRGHLSAATLETYVESGPGVDEWLDMLAQDLATQQLRGGDGIESSYWGFPDARAPRSPN